MLLILLAKLFSLVYVTSGTTRELYFNSYNCDESPRRVTEDKSYELTWEGKTDPPPCSFNFTAGESTSSYQNYKLCFKCDHFDLIGSGAKIIINDKSSTWVYQKYDYSVEKTCVEKVKNLGIWVEIDRSYIESSALITITVTAETITETDDSGSSFLDSIQSFVVDLIPVVFIGLVVFFICSNRERVLNGLKEIRDKIVGICEIKHESSSPNRNRRCSISVSLHSIEDPEQHQQAQNVSSSSSDLSHIGLEMNDSVPPAYPSDNQGETTLDAPPPYPSDSTGETTPNAPPPSYDDLFKDQK